MVQSAIQTCSSTNISIDKSVAVGGWPLVKRYFAKVNETKQNKTCDWHFYLPLPFTRIKNIYTHKQTVLCVHCLTVESCASRPQYLYLADTPSTCRYNPKVNDLSVILFRNLSVYRPPNSEMKYLPLVVKCSVWSEWFSCLPGIEISRWAVGDDCFIIFSIRMWCEKHELTQ